MALLNGFGRVGISPRDYRERSKAAFDKAASTYDSSSEYGFGEHARKVYPHILEKLRETCINLLLDVGIGTGTILAAILNEKDFKAA